ncbi:hypothetical protein [Rhizobium sp. NZLR11]|uniref:hypothetical protein n=1 Tax=Rhizobium sp. NZLR11 TaxID=2731098 RepID=UPI001C83475B|nr:hypothetical protein [Rhizobium sp. NZLR11]MBX5206729.1 hypothetical protein [Rhizobium sp. NZLR11]
MTDLSTRIADHKRSEAVALTEHTRLIGALNKAVTLILAVAVFGLLTLASMGAWNEQLRTQALVNQENVHVSR